MAGIGRLIRVCAEKRRTARSVAEARREFLVAAWPERGSSTARGAQDEGETLVRREGPGGGALPPLPYGAAKRSDRRLQQP
ncbi:hypothetical protein GCM10015536_67970 [Streptomyces griseomycini]|nr:hypothetical protein GCM10015536_67970 [Streptomyces griseomycini]